MRENRCQSSSDHNASPRLWARITTPCIWARSYQHHCHQPPTTIMYVHKARLRPHTVRHAVERQAGCTSSHLLHSCVRLGRKDEGALSLCMYVCTYILTLLSTYSTYIPHAVAQPCQLFGHLVQHVMNPARPVLPLRQFSPPLPKEGLVIRLFFTHTPHASSEPFSRKTNRHLGFTPTFCIHETIDPSNSGLRTTVQAVAPRAEFLDALALCSHSIRGRLYHFFYSLVPRLTWMAWQLG